MKMTSAFIYFALIKQEKLIKKQLTLYLAWCKRIRKKEASKTGNGTITEKQLKEEYNSISSNDLYRCSFIQTDVTATFLLIDIHKINQ